MNFSMHFSKSTLFSNIARYVFYVTDIRLPDALIHFRLQPIAEELAKLGRMHKIISKPRNAHAQTHHFLLFVTINQIHSNSKDGFTKKQIKLSSPLAIKNIAIYYIHVRSTFSNQSQVSHSLLVAKCLCIRCLNEISQLSNAYDLTGKVIVIIPMRAV